MNKKYFSRSASRAWFFGLSCLVVSATSQAQLPADVQEKVNAYKTQLQKWASHPVIVNAVKNANATGSVLPDMSNSRWLDVPESDPRVTQLSSNDAGALMSEWEADPNISKLYLRDAEGNMVAAGRNKPLLWNNKTKPPFQNAIKGEGVWTADEIKPDPASQIPGVHVSAPIMDGGKAIGVLHTSVVAK